jgi:GNAT superfamily N-acetyltransferase
MAGILYPEEQGVLAPATVNPLLLRQVQAQRAANPRPNVTDFMGYGNNWGEYGQNFVKNLSAQLPQEGEDSSQFINKMIGFLGLGGMTVKSSDGLKALREAWRSKGVSLDAYQSGNSVNLGKIEVPKNARGKGIGTQAMKELNDYADQNGLRVTLSPTNEFGASKERLRAWYKSMGFVDNKGRTKDFTISETMYRDPRGALERPAGKQKEEKTHGDDGNRSTGGS